MKTVCKQCGSEDVTVTVVVNPNNAATIADYCAHDETITEDGWCNRCGDYVGLEAVGDDGPADPMRCERCGSTALQQRVWRSVKTMEVVREDDCDRNDYYCENCEENRYPVRESELLQNANKWWSGTDFEQMKRVTDYRQTDFDHKDGYQAFVDACNEWWDEKTTDEKIIIYIVNQ